MGRIGQGIVRFAILKPRLECGDKNLGSLLAASIQLCSSDALGLGRLQQPQNAQDCRKLCVGKWEKMPPSLWRQMAISARRKRSFVAQSGGGFKRNNHGVDPTELLRRANKLLCSLGQGRSHLLLLATATKLATVDQPQQEEADRRSYSQSHRARSDVVGGHHVSLPHSNVKHSQIARRSPHFLPGVTLI